jgi:tetratricopeptide (TPR) repeat protein
MKERWIPAGVFVLGMILYVVTLPPTILPGDSGELIAASRTLSVAHPPGYPLYLLIGKLFSSFVGLGSVAYRYNLLSAVVASATVALVYSLLRGLGVHRVLAIGISLGLASQEAYWLQSTAAEVYPLNAFFAALLLYVALLGRKYAAGAFLLLGYLGGLAVSHHLTLVYALLSAVIFVVLYLKILPRPGTLVLGAFLFLIGLTAWVYIPIRASLKPPLAWGDTDTLGGFVSHVLAHRYAWRLKSFDFIQRVGDFFRFFRFAAGQTGILLGVLAVAGLALHFRKFAFIAGFVCLILFYAFHYATYNIPDIEGHIVPFLIGAAILAGLGAQGLLVRLQKVSKTAGPVLLVAIFAIPVINCATLTPRRDAWFAYDFAVAIAESAWESCGHNPMVINEGHLAGLSLLYLSLVEEVDVTLYVKGVSHPSVIGVEETPESTHEVVQIATRDAGAPKVAMLGGLWGEILPGRARICGMVTLPEAGETYCRSPLDFPVRGVGSDLRDFFSRALTAQYYLHIARWCVENGDTASADENLDRVIQVAGDAQTYVEVSRLYVEVGRLADAERMLLRAVKAEPTHFFAQFALGSVYSMTDRQDEALPHFKNALRGTPNPVPALLNIGNIYWSRGDHDQALSFYNQALEHESSDLSVMVRVGTILESRGRVDEAVRYFDRALSLDSTYAPAIHTKASLLLRLARYDEVHQLLARGLRANGDEPLLLADMGLYYLRSDAPDSSAKYLEAALEKMPTLLSARGNLAVAYERLGLTARAAEHYRLYVEDSPPGTSRDRAAEALRRLEQ